MLGKSDQKEVIWWTGDFCKLNNVGSQSPVAYNPGFCDLVKTRMKTSVRNTRERAPKDKDDVETLQETLQEEEQEESEVNFLQICQAFIRNSESLNHL